MSTNLLDLLSVNSTFTNDLCVGSALESSRTLQYDAALRSASSTNHQIKTNYARSLFYKILLVAAFSFTVICVPVTAILAEEKTAELQDTSSEDSIDTGEGEDTDANQPDDINASPHVDIKQNADSAMFDEGSKVKIIALNKITAKSQEMVIHKNKPQYFGNIEIKIHRCLKALDPYSPENKALLSITESKVDEDQIPIFRGWMFSSSISLSTLEHPVYEIFVKECLQ